MRRLGQIRRTRDSAERGPFWLSMVQDLAEQKANENGMGVIGEG